MLKAILALLVAVMSLLLTLPIWFYLLYKILVAVNATDLMWFLYWVYVPFSLIIHIAAQAAKAASE
jgi:hypothetical protein